MKTQALVLAAGKGSRMGGDLPKVLHPFLNRPLLHHVLDSLAPLSDVKTALILGYQAQSIQDACQNYDFEVVMQHEQLGTGHAVQQAISLIEASSVESVLILPGDCPSIQTKTLNGLIDVLEDEELQAALLTAVLDDPAQFGRILKDAKGQVRGIQEFKDCSPDQKQINEINSGIYIFRKATFLKALKNLDNKNSQGEFYLTDVIAQFYHQGFKIKAITVKNIQEVMGVNTHDELKALETFHKINS